MRKSLIERKTKETSIRIELNLDGSGESRITSEIGFLNHMLETFARHGLFDLSADINGDLHTGLHHTIEDAGIALGEAFKKALGDKKGVRRSGFFMFPMDEALATAAVDLSGRAFLKFEAKFRGKTIGDVPADLFQDFFGGFAGALQCALHIRVHYGRSDHHKIEAVFKAFAKAMREACEPDKRRKKTIPSTKGIL